MSTKEKIAGNALYLAWATALAATLGSLYFSEVMLIEPCPLCWYQRILMYPLVVILAVGIIKKDKNLTLYALPFALLGMVIALYQTLLQEGFIAEAINTCTTSSISCADRQTVFYDFLTIPLLSFLGFAIITVSLIIYKKYQNDQGS